MKNRAISRKIVIARNEAIFLNNERLLQKLRNFAMTVTEKRHYEERNIIS
jgi:hypothetical protein